MDYDHNAIMIIIQSQTRVFVYLTLLMHRFLEHYAAGIYFPLFYCVMQNVGYSGVTGIKSEKDCLI